MSGANLPIATRVDAHLLAGRREFLAQIARLGALAAAGGVPEALAQVATPPADPPGTVPNADVLAAKLQGFSVHSARPLTGSLPAEYQISTSRRTTGCSSATTC